MSVNPSLIFNDHCMLAQQLSQFTRHGNRMLAFLDKQIKTAKHLNFVNHTKASKYPNHTQQVYV